MGRPGALLNWQIAGKGGFVHPLVQLKKMRMAVANADPEDVRNSFCGKGAESDHGKKKCAKRDRREFFLEQIGGLRIDRGKKREGEVDLLWRRKNQAAIMRIERGKRFCELVR